MHTRIKPALGKPICRAPAPATFPKSACQQTRAFSPKIRRQQRNLFPRRDPKYHAQSHPTPAQRVSLSCLTSTPSWEFPIPANLFPQRQGRASSCSTTKSTHPRSSPSHPQKHLPGYARLALQLLFPFVAFASFPSQKTALEAAGCVP